ncbi:Por secretion system C-terminal sorting domain-containing protein [Lishizhenia tianjinensis]|uniref:Por secretion system C-terminal sorting domain-containing protein n=1 Tax=Lishizhenia tianjinensis TaxID=477690 RepID=A0A1I6YMS2_9FLAO|nr:choice-of-anchor I family protein [Lishizhenia tianjinensis]SFT51799.1 Por secretion system C-terminal sorting domain-containing protein [Lishizhenia tianjinensis]
MKKFLLATSLLLTGHLVNAQTVELSFDQDFYTVKEGEATINLGLSLNAVPTTDVNFEVALMANIGNITPNYTTQSLSFTANGSTTQNLSVAIADDNIANNDGFFVVELSNLTGATIGSRAQTVVYVIDNDETVPTSTGDLNINYLTSYEVAPGESAEIVAFDEATDRLFVLNATATQVEILDFSNPSNISSIASIDMTAYGAGATSVAVKNGIVAATVDVPNFGNGKVVFMDTDGNLLNSVEVGNLPDMVCFTPDGTKVLTANEGQPNDGYTIDPEGTISIIDITGGIANLTQADVNTITFNAFDAQEAQLKAAGVRIFGAGATVSQDMEPEFISVNATSTLAWVSLQENNAIATIDLVTEEITEILPLGTKDHSLPGNGLDISDKTDSVAIMNWNVKGMYMPDAIATYAVNGVDYIVTANEGDQREYGVIDEDVSVGDSGYDLDPTLFPNAALLKEDFLLGRIAASPYDGDTDGDGDIDEIHIFGARSFSIWNASTGALVYDSGDEFERITANDPIYGELFNASNSNNNIKNRSDNKGPEPEGITVQKINNDYYAFVTLERTGGMMVYNITNPTQAAFVKYANSRDLGANEGGDLGPEGIIYISENESPNNTAMIIMANEVSATLSIYTVENMNHSGLENNNTEAGLLIYPNPAQDYIYFNTVTTGVIVNAMGQEVLSFQDKAYLNIDQLEKGIYYLKTEATTVNFIVQ